jgi:multidrug resistance efflux pump
LKAGESVSTTLPQPIVSLADTSQIRVRAEVDVRDVGRVRLGQRVVVLADAYPAQKYGGRVSRMSMIMGRKKVRTGDPAEKSDRDVLEVLVELDDADRYLVVGHRTTVQFLESPGMRN